MKLIMVLIVLLSLPLLILNIDVTSAWYNTPVQNSILYNVAILGTTTQYGYIGPSGDRHPQFYSALVADGAPGTIFGFVYPELVKIEVSGTDPLGAILAGDRFTALSVLSSPDDSGVEQQILKTIFDVIVDLAPKGLSPIVKNTLTEGGATTGWDSTKAWGVWQRPYYALVSEERGLRFGYQLVVDPAVEGTYTVNIHYHAWICAYDGVTSHHLGFIDLYDTVTYTYVKTPPEPSTPSGPTSGYKGISYSYSTSTTDPNDDSLRYEFDWDDGSTTITGWYTSGATASASHSWSSPGVYYVKVRAQDSTGAWSGWSSSLAVDIINRPPNTPSTPSGSTSGYRNVWYTYSTNTTDPDSDDVRYEFDWGDGSTTTTDWMASGSTASASHTWGSLGTYNVKVRAQDIYEEWSNWSPTLTVGIVNSGPNTPSTPSGPTTVYRNVWYTYSTSATDPDGDIIRYHLNATGPGNPYQNTTIWVDSGTSMSWNLLWELTDSPGTYLIQTWVEDVYGALSQMTSLSVNMVNIPPNNPTTPSGPNYGYKNEWHTYTACAADPESDNVYYQFEITGPNTNVSLFTDWCTSGQNGCVTIMWNVSDPPGTYQVRARAQDTYGALGAWSSPFTVTIYDRVPNTPSTPSGPTLGYTGNSYTYSTSTIDSDGDTVRYQFDWGDGTTTWTGWYASGVTVSVSHHWSSPGTYYVKVRAQDYWGALSSWSANLVISISVESGGPGGCPALLVWNGTSYVDYGVINIHNSSIEDVMREVYVTLEDVNINKYMTKFRLREGWLGLNFSESFIDQVKLYAIDSPGDRYLCPLISAKHSRLGNVWHQLFLSDDCKTQVLLMETIDLTFITPYQHIQGFVFVIEGCNPYKT
jgi:hypothetical protein